MPVSEELLGEDKPIILGSSSSSSNRISSAGEHICDPAQETTFRKDNQLGLFCDWLGVSSTDLWMLCILYVHTIPEKGIKVLAYRKKHEVVSSGV